MSDLSTLEDLRAAVAANYSEFLHQQDARVESLYCPDGKCTTQRPMEMLPIIIGGTGAAERGGEVMAPAPFVAGEPYDRAIKTTSILSRLMDQGMAPALVQLRCVVCSSLFTAVVYRHEVDGKQVEDVAVFPSKQGGLATKNTPKPVAYYLDQAARCESVNARSAAVAMYRVALEHLLLNQKYTGMLGEQVKAVESDQKAGKGPPWVKDLNHQDLDVLRKLGNGTLHTNHGDISLQDNATPELLSDIRLTFQGLLEQIIERPLNDAARLQRMSTAAQAMTPPKPPKTSKGP